MAACSRDSKTHGQQDATDDEDDSGGNHGDTWVVLQQQNAGQVGWVQQAAAGCEGWSRAE